MDNYSMTQDPPIQMIYAAAKAHVPHAKRNLHNTRACLGNISWIALYSFTMHFGQISGSRGSRKLNFLDTVSPNSSARHCKHALVDYVQANDDNDRKRTIAACSLDFCIFVPP